MDAIAHTQVSGLCLVTLVVLLRAQQKMRDKSLPGRQFTALLWFAGALTIVDYGSALAQLGAWEELGIPLTYRLNAGGSILFYLLAACCCLLVFLYVETELGHTWMEDGRRLALSAAPVTLLLLVLLTARDENGFYYLDAEGLRGSTLFWGAKLVGLAYLAAAFLRCSWTLSHWKQETPKEELKTLLLLALAPAAGFLLQGWLPGRGLLCCGITLGLVCVCAGAADQVHGGHPDRRQQPHRGAALSGKQTALLPPPPQPLAAFPHDGHGSLQAHQR